ncbi:hypothetical protein [Streptomyces sp. NPDC048172]|uniref:hypothetical protein n=1 Tax=Streptomyces sp. NPDC048172 TaxID=3365505 RepID=UPI0037224574
MREYEGDAEGGVAAFYPELLGARLAFERAATASDSRIAVLDVGGAGEIETLPTQWTMTARDPDGRAVDVRAHRPRT